MGEGISPEIGAVLRRIPSVDEMLLVPSVQLLLGTYPRWVVRDAVREVLAEERRRLLNGDLPPDAAAALLVPAALAARVADVSEARAEPSLRPVLNATGVVLHTNLGRAPLAPSACDAIQSAARGYTNLEFDLASGSRGSRQAHVEGILCALTGAEAALVVNNNAAAVLLGINTLADGKEIVISRGELVEIGDSFRIPDVMVRAGGRLREVGTTNRTHLTDYEAAIGPETALVLRVHRSNFQVLGFTADVDVADLVALARRRDLPVMEDLGSGALLDLGPLGLRREPLASDGIKVGVDLVTFSGDKLLGGPQAGILVGRREILARVRRNPLARTVRIDKLCLAALGATLRLYLEPERALREIPILRMLSLPASAVGQRAEALASSLRAKMPALSLAVEEETSEVGGGALPLQRIPTRILALRPAGESAGSLEARLRRARPPVLVRIKDDRILLDLRTVEPADDPSLLRALSLALAPPSGGGAA
jgi:L-seryl-tRNA(Ser) seleniumtransferase